MSFKVLVKKQYPRRLWALAGFPGSGKSTFAARMMIPQLVIDADHRYDEVVHLAGGDVYQLENRHDNVLADRVVAQLNRDMPEDGQQIGTIVVDSLTEIITPLVMKAVNDNANGRNKNRAAAFVDKAVAMRLLQSGVSRWGTDVLWIYHLQAGMDSNGRDVVTTSIPKTELTRMVRSLNAKLRVVQDGDRRGIHVEWCRNGRDGFTLWDEAGLWQGMPERLEEAMYVDGRQDAPRFSGPDAALDWAMEQGAFPDREIAQLAYNQVKTEQNPANAAEMWAFWVATVRERTAVSEEVAY